MPDEQQQRMPFDALGVECSAGWAALYEPLIALVEKKGGTVLQVKEKFGGLRFYYTAPEVGPDQVDVVEQAVQLAEKASWHICEECGEPAKSRDGGWIRTLCSLCHQDRETQRIEREHRATP